MKELFNAIWPYASLPLLAIALYLLYYVCKQLFMSSPHRWEDEYEEDEK